ncbi:MAG: exo-alpha-sialidase, partial [Prevotella sp.]|nr:exo-alpha-sialidase [Prevotella sp.]
NGKTWALTKNLFDSSKFYDENSSNGKLSMSNYFTTSGKGLTTNDGVIMFATNCRKVGDGTNLVCIIYSTDNGNSWRLSKSIAYTGGDESKLEQMNDGSLLLSVRQSGNRGWNTATYSKNADGTVDFKWGSQYRKGDISGNACNADILYYNRKNVDGMDIMLHSYINTGGRESLQLAMSLDGGKSWKSVYNIQPNGSCYSTMIQLPNGNVALLYEDESYSAGNGYAINYVTITKEQILDWYQKNGGIVTDIEDGIRLETAADDAIYDLQGRRMTQSRLPKGIYVQQGRKFVVK